MYAKRPGIARYDVGGPLCAQRMAPIQERIDGMGRAPPQTRGPMSTPTNLHTPTLSAPTEPLTTQDLRLFLEELCCELCRFLHMTDDGLPPEALSIEREYPLGDGAFADVRVARADGTGVPYFVEVKWGVPDDELLSRLSLKYGRATAMQGAGRLVVVLDTAGRGDRDTLLGRIRAALPPSLVVELWDEEQLLTRVRRLFHIHATRIDEQTLLDMREAVARVTARYAFEDDHGGEDPNAATTGVAIDALREQLLWRFAFWRLRQIRGQRSLHPRQFLPPGTYRGVAVVIADLCSFSSYVRDTPDDTIVRDSLTSFYSKARYEVVNRGGMIENFVGDQVLALFGVPDRCPGYIDHALQASRALLSVGEAVSDFWQRQLDRQQPSAGMHIGVAYGDLQIVALRPSSRTHSTAIADVINVAARLMNMAGPGEVLVANSFYKQLSAGARAPFQPIAPQDARNVGRLRAYRLPPPSP